MRPFFITKSNKEFFDQSNALSVSVKSLQTFGICKTLIVLISFSAITDVYSTKIQFQTFGKLELTL